MSKKIKVFEIKDKTDNLCNYCNMNYPDCSARIKFSTIPGCNIIIGCDRYSGVMLNDNIIQKGCSEEEMNLNYEE